MTDIKAGTEFRVRHAAGITMYEVLRDHRDAGFFECVSRYGVSGTHHFVGAIQVFSRSAVEIALTDGSVGE